MKHRPVGGCAAGKMVASDDTLEALALAGAHDVDALTVGEDGYEYLITSLHGIATRGHSHFAPHPRRRHAGFLVVASHRLARLGRPLLDERQLDSLVTVGLRILSLQDDARSRLDDGGRVHRAVRIEDLRHAEFSADDASNH